MHTNATLDVGRKVFLKVVSLAGKEAVKYSSMYTSTIKQDQSYERIQHLSGFGELAPIGEGEAANIQRRRVLRSFDIESRQFANGFEYTNRARYYDQYNELPKNSRLLAMSHNKTKEKDIARIFNLGFNGTAFPVLGTTSPVFSATHTYETGGTTFSNTGTAAALSVTALQSAMVQLRTQVDAQGVAMDFIPSRMRLIVPPALEFVASEILKSTNRPYEQTNTPNVLGSRIDLMVLPWITSTTAWFLVPEKADEADMDGHGFRILQGMPRYTRTGEDTRTGNILFILGEEWAPVVVHVNNIYGNQGA